MTVEITQTNRSFEGTPRIALDDGAKAQVNRDIEAARTQFHAAVESMIRTQEGENTVAGGTAHISSVGASKLSVFNAVGEMFGIGAQRATASRPQGRGR